ncbi:MAG: VWA domain-containing protein [candidate division KSB1 bacterium]|nr:VWA domain-containing protein [candidate division KSB1 bacterium]MDZ7294942.1 VWA domain-containing protein [candidate division KSB1 bacterium]MDZ7378022.1 VWA domain-containing protein [candidate division KSB1 bacterium]MDZ7414045.1 VWA domain-containing protein [candidate division KSB1 bacterium]
MLRFANEQILYLLLVVPLLALFYAVAFRWKRRAMERFGHLPLVQKLAANTSRRRQVLKAALVILAAGLMVLSLARPQIGTKLEEVKRSGVDIIIALDVSLSMQAEDVKPNRLAKAKREIEQFIGRLEGDRVGLVAFAGEAFLQCPLTLDYAAAEMFLDIMEPSLIPTPGTAIGEAIAVAMKAFEQKERKHKVLVLVTDGEDHGSDPVEIAKQAAREGVVIYTIGIGSVEGVPIPVYDQRGQLIDWKKDRSGQRVTSRLDEVTLQKIAQETGGAYYRATGGAMELDKIYERIAGMEKKELGSLRFSQFEERFQYLLVLVLVLLVVEPLIPERRTPRREWYGRFA